MSKRQRLFLIDGSSYIYRAYYAIRHLSNSRGLACNAVLGFTKMLLKVMREHQPDQLVVVFDAKGSTFRKDIYPEYKANRAKMPEDLVPQIPYIKQIVSALNIASIEQQGFEADDIIATLARQKAAHGCDVVIVTGDKDLMQVVSERVQLLDTMKDKISGLDEVKKRFGGTPDKVIEVQALAGDSSDNVPGVPGIGRRGCRAHLLLLLTIWICPLMMQLLPLENQIMNSWQHCSKSLNLHSYITNLQYRFPKVTKLENIPV